MHFCSSLYVYFQKIKKLYVLFAWCFRSCCWALFRQIPIFPFKIVKTGNFEQLKKKKKQDSALMKKENMWDFETCTQWSDCSRSESDKYTDSRMKENVFQKRKKRKKVFRSHVVYPNCAWKFILFYPSTWLAVATSWDLHYTLRESSQ